MSITDELRSLFARKLAGWKTSRHEYDEVAAVADRIDAAHESEISRAAQLLADAEKDRDFNYANWQDCKQRVLQHNITMDELSAEIERLKDELAHCIELPKDADGEYIHMGDRMENGELVVRIVLTDGSWEPTVYTASTPNQLREHYCHNIRHYHATTVEDVLSEMLDAVDDDRYGQDRIIAEFAAKLRLAESE